MIVRAGNRTRDQLLEGYSLCIWSACPNHCTTGAAQKRDIFQEKNCRQLKLTDQKFLKTSQKNALIIPCTFRIKIHETSLHYSIESPRQLVFFLRVLGLMSKNLSSILLQFVLPSSGSSVSSCIHFRPDHVEQGWSKSLLQGRCPAGFACFSALTHLILNNSRHHLVIKVSTCLFMTQFLLSGCRRKETSKTCRTAALQDRLWTPLM